MTSAEYACVFVRASKERLVAAERLVRAIPAYLGGGVADLDLYHCAASGYLAAVVHAAPAILADGALARLGFWAARTGARGFLASALPEPERRRFEAELALCERALRGVPAAALGDAAGRFFRELGNPLVPAAGPPAPVLGVDLDGPGAGGIAYRAEQRALFVAALLAPPLGDQLTVVVRDRKAPRPVEGWATVVEVRPREQAGPGRPAGFTLRIEGPSALHELLAERARAGLEASPRAAPRFPVKAPVKVTPVAPAQDAAAAPSAPAPRPPPAPAAAPHAVIRYATEQQLRDDWLENLSHGGAFVRTASPRAVGTELVLELALPDGARLEARGAVVVTNGDGMGIRFALDATQDAVLAAALARIAGRPRRALVVDDDVLVRNMLSDALAGRGFEVLTAASADDGVRILSEELLALDLLVTDVCMPGRDGEELVRFIRSAGGEADLAIVAVSGRLEPGAEERLEAAGADAVLDKALGPELLAQAADAALERKRLVSGGP